MPLNIDWQQILLHLLNFTILAGGLYFLLYRPVKDFMVKREAYYAEREALAQKTQEEAQTLHDEARRRLDAVEDEISALRAKAGDEIEAEKKRRLDAAHAEAERILKTAEKTAQLRSQKAIADTHDELRALAVEATEKLMLNGTGALDAFLDAAESESHNG